MRERVEDERQRRAEGEGRGLAPVVIERGLAHLDGAVRHGVEHLQTGHDFTGGEGLDLEFVVGDFSDALGEIFAAAVQGIERLRPACRVSPLYLRVRLRNRRCCNRSRGETDAAHLQEITTFHLLPLYVFADTDQGTTIWCRLLWFTDGRCWTDV